MKFKVVCDGIPMVMSRKPDDKYYAEDGYLAFSNQETEFDNILLAAKAVEMSIQYGMKHGYEKSWGIFSGYSVIPCGGAENG